MHGFFLFPLFLICFLFSACSQGPEQDASLKKEEAFIHYELGLDYYGIGEMEKAVDEWKQAVVLNPYSEAHHMLGYIHFLKNDFEAAKKEWEIILSMDPKNPMTLNNMGNLYKAWGKEEMALEYYSQAAEVDPKLAITHCNIATIHLNRGELGLAREKFTKALELDPKMSIAILQMGNALLQEGKQEEAMVYYKKLADGGGREEQGFNPRLAGFTSLGKLSLTMRNFEESEKYLNKGLEIQPENPDLRYSLGNVYENLGKKEDAIKEYQRVVQSNPGFAYAYNGLGNLYAEMGENLEEAEKYLLRGMEIDPALKPHFIDSLGWVYFKQGKLEEALAKAEEAISLSAPEQKEGLSVKYFHLGMIYKAKGEKEKALENFKKSVEMDPQGESAKKAKENMG